MKRTIIGTVLSTTLILGGMLNAANADTWVFKDMLRPNGHDRSVAAKRADGRKCGALPGGRSFNDADAPNMKQCMFARGWTLDHVIPDSRSAHARGSSHDDDNSPPPQIDNSNDDWVRRQQDQDNTQQTLNQQNFNNTQQMINDQQFQQQQQQMINNMNGQ
jgi:hypothetical protein